MTRKTALVIIRTAGSENDSKTATRAMIEGRIGLQAYQEAWDIGQKLGGHFKPLVVNSEPLNREESIKLTEEAAQKFRQRQQSI